MLRLFCSEVYQLDNRRYLANYERSGKKVTDLLDTTMIYTYIDEEPYLPSHDPITTETDTESYLASAFDSKILENQLNDRQLKAADRIHREKDVKVMHICFVTDLDVPALSNANVLVLILSMEMINLVLELTENRRTHSVQFISQQRRFARSASCI